MSDVTLRFDDSDFQHDLPPPGFYVAAVVGARFRMSQSGNDTIQVTFEIEGVPPSNDRVAEYFVLRGSNPRGRALARQRLVELYEACGLAPKGGEAIDPADLFGARLQVKLGHDAWQGQPRLAVIGHRPLGSAGGAAEPLFS